MGMRMEDTRTIRNQILCLVSARRHTGSKGDFEAHLSRTDTHTRTRTKGHKCQNDEQHDPHGPCNMVWINKEKDGQWTNAQRERNTGESEFKDDKKQLPEFTGGTIGQEKHSESLKT